MENDNNAERIRQNQAKFLSRMGGAIPEGELIGYDNYGIPDPDSVVNPTTGEQQRVQPPQAPPPQQRGFMPNSPGAEQPKRGFMPNSTPDNQPLPQQPRAQPTGVEAYRHPVVDKLLTKFGINRIKPQIVEVVTDDASIRFALKLIPDELSLWAIQRGQDKTMEEGLQSGTGWLETLHIACAVVEMDGVPIWEVFGIRPNPEEARDLQRDPLDVSPRLLKLTAMHLGKLLWSKLPMVTDKLHTFYKEVVSTKKMVESSYELDKKKTQGEEFRFVCPAEACDYQLVEALTLDDQGIPYPVHCKRHGTMMVKVASKREESEFPLV